MDAPKIEEISSGRALKKVIVHPLVLLSVVDHYIREAVEPPERVIGVLLGSSFKGAVDVTDSFALSFEENEEDPRIYFLDEEYLESMFSMFKRINAKEHVVGWYSTCPELRKNDLDFHTSLSNFIPNPVLVLVDVNAEESSGRPTKAYYVVEEIKKHSTQKSDEEFVPVPSEIAAHKAEEIGVEHLLRDVKDTTTRTLATEVSDKIDALKKLNKKLGMIREYLDLVIDGSLPLNHEILNHLQNMFNLLPNLTANELIKAFAVKTNDMMLVIYLSSIIRSVVALHNLINNKILNKERESTVDSEPAAIPTTGHWLSSFQY